MKIQKDKWQHFLLGIAYSLFFGLMATIAFAFLWEINDKRHGAMADFGDVMATTAGGIIGGAAHLWIMYQCWGTIVFP